MANKTVLKETVRSDGLLIISARLPYTKRVYFGITSRAGSAHDPAEMDGLFHFYEHMAFKGTTLMDSKTLRNALSYFLYNNAFTDRTHVTYEAVTVGERFRNLCAVMCDLYLNSIFPAEELDKEKKVVLLEIKRDEDEDALVASNALAGALYRENPVRKFGVGTREGLANVTRDILVARHREWYVPANTVVVCTGDVRHDTLLREVERWLPVNDAKVSRPRWGDESFMPPVSRNVVLERPERNKVILEFGCKLPTSFETACPEAMEPSVFMAMMGGAQNSLLWNAVREDRGMSYAVGAALHSSSLANFANFFAETLPEDLETVKEIILDTALNAPLSNDHMELTKSRIRDAHIVSPEGAYPWANHIFKNRVEAGWPLEAVERASELRMAALQKVTLEEIEVFRKTWITPERMACVVLKPS